MKYPNGETYQRREEIEAVLAKLEELPPSQLMERMKIATPSHPDFILPECVLYFVRKTKLDNSDRQFQMMYRALIARVEKAATVPGTRHYVGDKEAMTSRGSAIAEAVVFQFEVKLTKDRNGYIEGLDYYEVNFASALASLRLTAREKVDREGNRVQPLSYDEGESISPAVEKAAGSFNPFDQEKIDDPAYRSAVGAAINRLPEQERNVIMLTFKGYQDASIDPDAITISRLLGCNDQTVRNRRKRAIAKLQKDLEDFE